VTKDVPPYAIAVGVPARFVKYRFDEETVRRLLDKAWWDAPEGELPTVAEHIWDVEGFLSPNRP
jgi:hypothetical protein